MRIITLTQPWATLVAIGAKRIETRSWTTSYRGWLGIHAAKGFPTDARLFAMSSRVQRALARHGFKGELPRGQLLAIDALRDVVSTNTLDQLSSDEAAFGDYSLDRFGWLLDETLPHRLATPIACRGALGLWKPNEALLDQLRLQGVRFTGGKS